MKQITLNNQRYTAEELHQIPSKAPWQKSIVDFLKLWFDNNETITVQTSGSTGEPKNIELSKKSMRDSALTTNNFFGLDKSTTALLCLPANYIAGKMMLVRAIVGGYNLLTTEPSANPILDLKQDIDFMAVTPHQMDRILNFVETVHAPSLQKTTNIIIGGAPISSQLEKQCQSLSSNIYETYGMTETCTHIALRELNKEKAFKVLDKISIFQDDRNCLVISASHLSKQDIITNDMVEIIDETHFRWLGRIDNVINSGGIKIHPELLEKKIESLIPYRFFISSLPDEKLGQKAVLIIEADTPIANLKEQLKHVLGKFEMPKEILYLDEFICAENGKVLRNDTLCLHY